MKRLTPRTLTAAIVVLLAITTITLLGVQSMRQSRAATPTIGAEVEDGSLAGVNSTIDSAASGGEGIKFGTVATAGFAHPGILVGRSQLDFVKAKVQAGEQPWKGLFDRMKVYSLTASTYNAAPVANLDCAGNNDGCVALGKDGQAAYANALLWYYSGDRAYAAKAISIINAWSATQRTANMNNNNTYLYTSWAADSFPRAAEIIRYTYTPANGEPALNVAAFTALAKNVWLPMLAPNTVYMASSNGNWDLTMTEGMMNIGIFTDDKAVFNAGVERWRARTPAYVYNSSDNGGNGLPVTPPGGLYNTTKKVQCFWLATGQPSTTCDTTSWKLANGQTQETCRDYVHVGLGMASLFNAAETARLQGIDLYGEQRQRLVAGMEWNADVMTTRDIPNDICIGRAAAETPTQVEPTYTTAYNHYNKRLDIAMPNTAKLMPYVQYQNGLKPYATTEVNMIFEALTNFGTP